MLLPFDQLAAVCVDMDGTLVDTESIYSDARALAFEQLHGFQPTDEEALEVIGQPDHIAIGQMLARRSIAASFHDVLARTNELYLNLIETRPIAFPGTTEFLQRVAAAELSLALVTSAPRIQAEAILRILAIREAFRAVITLEDVQHPKPHPMPYLLACERLGARPSQSLVIEDSLPGIQAGKAACAYVVAVGSQPRSKADAWVRSLAEIRLCRE